MTHFVVCCFSQNADRVNLMVAIKHGGPTIEQKIDRPLSQSLVLETKIGEA